MNVIESIFSIFKGMKVIFKHLFRKPITLEYPEKKAVLNSRFRGRLALTVNEHNELNCIGCRSCIRVCPCFDVINIESRREENKVIIDRFDVDVSKCIFCGNCVNVCPKNAIVMTSEYELAQEDRGLLLRNKSHLTLSYEQSKNLEEGQV